MRPSDLVTTLAALYELQEPTCLWSPPGLGKSSILRQAADIRLINYLDIRLFYHDPSDFKFPLPDMEKRTIEWVCSLFPADPKWRGIICLEELPQSPPLVQNVASQVALDRMCGNYKLPEGAWVVACGNRLEDKANTHRMGTHLLSRFTHIDLEVSNVDWMAWAVENKIDPTVRAYLNYRPANLHQFDPSQNERAFPCPRSWEAVSRIVQKVPEELLLPVLLGKIGKPAAEYVGFRRIYMDLPDPDIILRDPMAADIPKEGAILYALAGALAEKVRHTVKDQSLGNIITYANRLPDEYSILIVRDGAAANARILDVPESKPWLKKHGHVLFPEQRKKVG